MQRNAIEDYIGTQSAVSGEQEGSKPDIVVEEKAESDTLSFVSVDNDSEHNEENDHEPPPLETTVENNTASQAQKATTPTHISVIQPVAESVNTLLPLTHPRSDSLAPISAAKNTPLSPLDIIAGPAENISEAQPSCLSSVRRVPPPRRTISCTLKAMLLACCCCCLGDAKISMAKTE